MITDLLIIISSFFLLGYSHSILASNKIKELLTNKFGNKIAFYRLFYNVFAIITFGTVYSLLPRPSQLIYDLQFPLDIIILAVQIFGLFGMLWAGSFIDAKEFFGISQIKRYFDGTYDKNDFDEKKELVINGAYKYSRHPIYFFSIIFIGARPLMNVFSFAVFILAALYFIIGAHYEEKKLAEYFGSEYTEYQKNVPMFVPYKIFRIKKKKY